MVFDSLTALSRSAHSAASAASSAVVGSAPSGGGAAAGAARVAAGAGAGGAAAAGAAAAAGGAAGAVDTEPPTVTPVGARAGAATVTRETESDAPRSASTTGDEANANDRPMQTLLLGPVRLVWPRFWPYVDRKVGQGSGPHACITKGYDW